MRSDCQRNVFAPRFGDDLHADGGEWRVERQRLSWEVLDAFREAAAEAGKISVRSSASRRSNNSTLEM